jgi:hypothetical protein
MASDQTKIDPAMFDIGRLVDTLLKGNSGPGWRQEAEIIPAYMPPFPQPSTRPRVAIRHGKCFLRYLAGPRQRFFWDVYGDDFLTPELALLALCQAEAPPAPSREHMEHLEATIAALTEARDWQQGKKEDAEAALRALQFKFDQLSKELARARATAADALARPAGAWSQMRAMARQVLVRHINAGGAADPVCASPDGEPITTAQMIERLDAGEDVSAFLDSLTGAALRLMRAELRRDKKEATRKQG